MCKQPIELFTKVEVVLHVGVIAVEEFTEVAEGFFRKGWSTNLYYAEIKKGFVVVIGAGDGLDGFSEKG